MVRRRGVEIARSLACLLVLGAGVEARRVRLDVLVAAWDGRGHAGRGDPPHRAARGPRVAARGVVRAPPRDATRGRGAPRRRARRSPLLRPLSRGGRALPGPSAGAACAVGSAPPRRRPGAPPLRAPPPRTTGRRRRRDRARPRVARGDRSRPPPAHQRARHRPAIGRPCGRPRHPPPRGREVSVGVFSRGLRGDRRDGHPRDRPPDRRRARARARGSPRRRSGRERARGGVRRRSLSRDARALGTRLPLVHAPPRVAAREAPRSPFGEGVGAPDVHPRSVG